MTAGERSAMRPALIVAAVVAALAGVTALVLLVAGDDDEPTLATSTSAPPPTTTTTTVEHQVSLVTDDEAGVLFSVGDVTIEAQELAALAADDEIAATVTVSLDGDFVAAQTEADLSLGRLRVQVQYLANRVAPELVAGAIDPPLVVAARPPDEGGALDAAVLVVNPGPEPRRLAFFDLRILDESGQPVTERIRFLTDVEPITVDAGAAYFNLVGFSAEQVLRPDADLTTYQWEAALEWEAPTDR